MRPNRQNAWLFSMLAAGFALAVSVTGTQALAPQTVDVVIKNFSFSPAELTVKSGTKIVFLTLDHLPHSVVGTVGDEERFRSNEQMDEEERFSVVLDRPETIHLFCGLHHVIEGKITVVP